MRYFLYILVDRGLTTVHSPSCMSFVQLILCTSFNRIVPSPNVICVVMLTLLDKKSCFSLAVSIPLLFIYLSHKLSSDTLLDSVVDDSQIDM